VSFHDYAVYEPPCRRGIVRIQERQGSSARQPQTHLLTRSGTHGCDDVMALSERWALTGWLGAILRITGNSGPTGPLAEADRRRGVRMVVAACTLFGARCHNHDPP
jgi:hypothetical protein